jgi:hypothetical protein
MATERSEFEASWVGQTGVRYERGGPGDRRHPVATVYRDCTVCEVIWPGSVINNDEGSWVAFRLRLRTPEGRQVTTTALPSDIPAARRSPSPESEAR